MSPMDNQFSVNVTPGGFAFETSDAVSVMEAALLADIDLPASCRNGTCRTCLCRLVSGSVRYRIEWPGVSADEKKEGWFLPCVAVAESDLVIDVLHARIRRRAEGG
jgi:ferredoxin